MFRAISHVSTLYVRSKFVNPSRSNSNNYYNNIGMTGEITLQGKITAIGGLDLKIIGGIRAGIKRFIYPHENTKEFDEFMEKYEKNPIIEGIVFTPVNDINEVLEIVLIKQEK